MKKQIKIILDPKISESQKGDFFENLVRSIFETQRYDITQRVNFTGMEIDLIASHKDRSETAYIECKARERLNSDDIRTFTFNVGHREANYGYLLSTTEFEHQVAGLIEEMKGKDKYSNLYFWGPNKIFELLESAKEITPLDLSTIKYTITKTILSYTYFGAFYILILMKNTIPTQFCVYNAKKTSLILNDEIIEKLKNAIPEIGELNFLPIPSEVKQTTEEEFSETVAEVQESEHWYDYLPASTKHFIGRKDLKTNLFTFLNQVSSKETSRRVFYIDGKSGWGKSSLITDLRGSSKNKHYRKRFFVLAVDARSASSSNFVALAFKKLIENAEKTNFLNSTSLFYPKLNITSSFDILGSESVQQLLKDLEHQNKTLILIFDQFEDVFRKSGLFKAFHKFLLDVNEVKSNFILGFSWKSEINIPINHEAYHLWQQTKDFAHCISMREFNPSEINGVIKQLEKTICRPIDLDLKRRLIESSQGFPWLIKKLCIHTYKQIQDGKTIENLVEQDLNCESLFKDDMEGLSPEEIRALNYIAKCSFDGNFFDATEVDEKIDEPVITALIYNRLVVKSGTKYNVYWDIFRDSLVTGKVPPIGESYILRKSVSVCFDLYKLFKDQKKFNLSKLKKLHPGQGIGTLDNILRELRSMGLIRKSGDNFQRSDRNIPATENGFREYLSKKFERYTPYLKLMASDKKDISISEIVFTLKGIFRGTLFSEKTWRTYAKYLISWFQFTNLDIRDRLVGLKSGVRQFGNRETFTPQQKPKKDIDVFCNLIDQSKINNFRRLYKSLYDLKSIGLITYSGNKVYLTKQGKLILKKVGKKEFEKSIAIEALKTKKIKQTAKYFFIHPECTIKEFGKALSDLTSNIKSEVYKKQVNYVLYAWAKFIYDHLDNANWIQ